MENTPSYLPVLLCTYGTFLLIIILSLGTGVRIVREDKRLSVYRLGRYIGEKGPGIVFLIPFVDKGVFKELGMPEHAATTGLVGMTGETHTTVFTSGKVLIHGEQWDATSQSVISAGRRVRVVKLILEVEEE